tara:strand:- start:31 stop:546 length:516 start_codon:yes stop_codon:yes gene_type:complete
MKRSRMQQMAVSVQRMATSVTLESGRKVWRALATERAPGGCAVHGCCNRADVGRRGLCHSHYRPIREAGGLDRIADTARRRANPAHDGTIYAITDSHGHIKVGFTRNLKQRMQTIKTHQAQPVELVAAWSGDMHDEACFHRSASPFQTQGEWYRDGHEIRALINAQITETT